MCIRSGGRQPPVARGTARAAAWRNCSRDFRPTQWRAPAQSRYHHTHGGLTRGALGWANRRLLAHGDFFCTRVLLPTAGSRPPLLCRVNRCLLVRGDFFCTRVLGTTAGSRPPLLRRNANVCRRNCDFCDARTHVHQERGASAPRGSRQRTCKGFAPRSARLPTVHQRTPTQSRCYILDNIHGGLTPAALVSGEPPPACAWRFLLHARSPNHGGLTPAALVLECERLPAKLRLLR
jgi:hypothetical protein